MEPYFAAMIPSGVFLLGYFSWKTIRHLRMSPEEKFLRRYDMSMLRHFRDW